MDSKPISCFHLGEYFQVDGKQLQQQYKDHISNYKDWEQREHAADWMVFADNIGKRLTIDETSLSNGELYTIVTNKAAKGRKGTIVAMIKGTQTEQIVDVLDKIPEGLRRRVEEVSLDMAANMVSAVRRSFPNAHLVTDRFHVQKLAHDAVQEIRIKYRWEALDQENKQIAQVKDQKTAYVPEVLSNGDTLKQLLARSRYLLFKHHSKWTESQKNRAELLFPRYPELKKAYDLAIRLGDIFRHARTRSMRSKN